MQFDLNEIASALYDTLIKLSRTSVAVFSPCLGRTLWPQLYLHAIQAGPPGELTIFLYIPAGIQTLRCCTNGILCLWVGLGLLRAPENSYLLPGIIGKITEDNQKLQYWCTQDAEDNLGSRTCIVQQFLFLLITSNKALVNNDKFRLLCILWKQKTPSKSSILNSENLVF